MPETYTIGDVCAEFGVTPRALRFYESKGLLSPIREGQKRLFTNRELARLKLILRGKRFGFALSEIKELLDLYHVDDGQVTQLSATLEAAQRHHEELVAQRDEMDLVIADIEEHMKQLRQMLEAKGVSQAAE
ncbi:MAG TPA: MerR family DNA-binding transcriptional regulator [Paracoccaceae bacterium]|nr:MerR family DNA-binding transcriptional regulator [Paracoccaceae bacterium]